MSNPADEDDLINIGELPPERVHLTRIGEVPQVSDFDKGAAIVNFGEDDDQPFPTLLPPDGKSPAEAEAAIPKELVHSSVVLDRLRERLTSKPEPQPETPAFRFSMQEGFIFLSALAVGLAIGRIDKSGMVALLLGFGVTILLVRVFFFGDAGRIWIIVAVSALTLYLGATLGTGALRLLSG